jgi:hypothetical protein
MKSDGEIKSKRIYIINFNLNSEFDQTIESIQNLIHLAMEKASKDNYKTISFPAIACGHYQYPNDIIAQTMIKKTHQEQDLFKISVSFIIQSDKIDLYNQFYKQIQLLNQSISNNFISTTIQNSFIQLEKGDITKQKVNEIYKFFSFENFVRNKRWTNWSRDGGPIMSYRKILTIKSY